MSVKKHGGLYFVRIGRVSGSFCITRKPLQFRRVSSRYVAIVMARMVLCLLSTGVAY